MNLAEVLRAHLELPHAILPGPINYAKAAGELRAFMSVKQLPASCTLFTQVDLSCLLLVYFHLWRPPVIRFWQMLFSSFHFAVSVGPAGTDTLRRTDNTTVAHGVAATQLSPSELLPLLLSMLWSAVGRHQDTS